MRRTSTYVDTPNSSKSVFLFVPAMGILKPAELETNSARTTLAATCRKDFHTQWKTLNFPLNKLSS